MQKNALKRVKTAKNPKIKLAKTFPFLPSRKQVSRKLVHLKYSAQNSFYGRKPLNYRKSVKNRFFFVKKKRFEKLNRNKVLGSKSDYF